MLWRKREKIKGMSVVGVVTRAIKMKNKTLKLSQEYPAGKQTRHTTQHQRIDKFIPKCKTCVHYTRYHKQRNKHSGWEKITASKHFVTNDQYQ